MLYEGAFASAPFEAKLAPPKSFLPPKIVASSARKRKQKRRDNDKNDEYAFLLLPNNTRDDDDDDDDDDIVSAKKYSLFVLFNVTCIFFLFFPFFSALSCPRTFISKNLKRRRSGEILHHQTAH